MFLTSCVTRKPAHFDIWRTCVTVELIDFHTEFPMAKEKLSPLHRPRLEIADIFRAQGHAWRLGNVGHVTSPSLKSCRRLKPAGQRRSVGMWQGALSAAIITSPTTVARTGTAPNVRDQPHAIGWKRGAEDLLPVEYFHVTTHLWIPPVSSGFRLDVNVQSDAYIYQASKVRRFDDRRPV